MQFPTKFTLRAALLGSVMIALAGCEGGFDLDLRHLADGFSTTQAVNERLSAERPTPDARGIISYPNYQVAVAQRGDTLIKLAARIGLPAGELARFNGLPLDATLRQGELVALPRRVSESAAGPITPAGGGIDITTLAGDALDRAGSAATTATGTVTASPIASTTPQSGTEPSRHRVERGETAYSIARAYGVSVRALADWNGLGPSLEVREGQHLLIPVAAANQPEILTGIQRPGQGTLTPVPPSAETPLPDERAAPLRPEDIPASPNLASAATAVSTAAMVLPVSGQIIRAFKPGTTDGIDISANAGDPVRAAADGIVAAITRNTDGVPILVLRHDNNVLTVYANIDNVTVAKGDNVTRGQKIAEVLAGDPAFLHFQVREGTQSVDPAGYLN